MDKINLVQINMGRGRQSLDLITRHLTNNDTSIALIQEPYTLQNKLPKLPHSIDVHEKYNHQQHTKSVILSNNTHVHLRKLHHLSTPNIMVTELHITSSDTKVYFISWYFEPSQPLSPYLNDLDRIGLDIDLSRSVISLDGNGRSTTWHDRETTLGGYELEQWICEKNLHILNEGGKYTFESHQGTSNIDVTLCGNAIAPQITNWHISETESLSDHNMIFFSIYFNNFKHTLSGKTSAFNYKKSRLENIPHSSIRQLLH